VSNVGRYAAFVRRFGGRFLRESAREVVTRIPPAPKRPDPASWRDDEVTIAWLGHATVLVNLFGTWLLTDPALGSRVGVRVGGVTVGPRRLVRPALRARQLPALDAVLLSHAHMDHTDLGTLARLPRATAAVVQSSNGDLVRRFRRVHELGWGESVRVGGARVEAIPVRHWGARRITDPHRGYGGFLVEKQGCAIVFGGDTAYTDAFAEVGRRARVDVAILPIGAYDPYIHSHASPEQSWDMARQMGARFLLPMHHSTFRLSREPAGEPLERVLAAAAGEPHRLAPTGIGETWRVPPAPEWAEVGERRAQRPWRITGELAADV
jgi:L-ascorbate metabolism protein UlaG (beta-lactamase superfamily)